MAAEKNAGWPIRLIPLFVVAVMLAGVVTGVLLLRRPAAAPATHAAGGVVNSLDEESFEHNSATISPEGRSNVAGLVWKAAKAGPAQWIVVGFADRDGGAEANLRLSERRARAIRDALVRGRIDPAAIRVCGMGEALTHAAHVCDTFPAEQRRRCYTPDRRVEIWRTSTTPAVSRR